MRTDRGLYVHIPFCVRKCNYCDFASFSPSEDFRLRYIDRLCEEIRSYAGREITLDTVFFGGGTPSLLTPIEFSKIMDSIEYAFRLNETPEFTVEVNPGAITDEALDAFLSRGVNRFSIGLQSIHKNEMKILGRIHSFEDFLSTYKNLRRRGVENISVDLMFGIPAQTKESFEKTLDAVIALKPEHVSAYGLIVEEGTPFFDASDRLMLPDEDAEREMYFLASERLGAAGYSHYEISNFAIPDKQCCHNLKYWRAEEYIGVGLAAHSYFDGVRFGNSRAAEEYMRGEGRETAEIDCEDRAFEYMMLAFRLAEGLSFSEYRRRFGEDFRTGKETKLDFLSKNGFIYMDSDRIALTERGFYVSNTLITELSERI